MIKTRRVGDRVVIAFCGSAKALGTKGLKDFTKIYTKMLKKAIAESPTGGAAPYLLVLFDLRQFTVNLLNPEELNAVTTLTNFFIGLRPMSESVVLACAAIIPSPTLAKVIDGALQVKPGKIPVKLSAKPETCKSFLTAARK